MKNLYATTSLGITHTNNSPDISRLWKNFGLGDMQCVVAGSGGCDLVEHSIGKVLLPQLEDDTSALRTIMKKAKCGVSAQKLAQKIIELSAQDERDLTHAARNFHARFEPSEIFLNRLLPDASILRAEGFVAPSRPVASGYCVFVLHDDARTHEMVLYGDLEAIPEIEALSVDQCAETATQLVELLISDNCEDDRKWLAKFCYQLIVKMGSPFLRVEKKNAKISVIPIPVDALRSDLSDHSLRSLALAGINAPKAA